MSVLNDGDIKREMELGNIVVERNGVPEVYIGPSSIDLHLDNRAMILDEGKIAQSDFIEVGEYHTFKGLDFRNKEKSAEMFTRYDGWDNIVIYPGEFYILSTIEKIKFPADVVGFIQGRSSIARMGINIHAAGFFDAGFEGTATLEVTNFTKFPIVIPKWTRICQMVFVKCQSRAEVPYNLKKDNKYNGQSGPTVTRIHNDYGTN